MSEVKPQSDIPQLANEVVMLREALIELLDMQDSLFKKINWGASFLDGATLEKMNVVPVKARRVLESTGKDLTLIPTEVFTVILENLEIAWRQAQVISHHEYFRPGARRICSEVSAAITWLKSTQFNTETPSHSKDTP